MPSSHRVLCCLLLLPSVFPSIRIFTNESALCISSVEFSHSVMSDSLHYHGLKHARLPCPSSTPGIYSNSCPLGWWCHPTISSSVITFSSHLQSFPASESFQMSRFFTTGSQNIGVSASTLVLPMNTQDWSPLGWTGWISLQSKGLSRVFSNTTVQKPQFFMIQLSYPYMTTGKTIAVTRWILMRLVIAFLPWSKHLLISWLQSHLQWFWSPRK